MDSLTPLDILVIEDDADALANMRDILELDNCRVTSAMTAAEVLDRKDWSRFTAIILDRQLPDSSADVLLPTLRAAAPEAAVIVVTGYSDLQGAIAALRQGAADYILKPLNIEALRASLTRIAERRRLALAKERSEAAFRHLVEAAECMIVILRPDRSILYFNSYAERLTGYSAREVQGRDYFALFIPEAHDISVRGAVHRVLDGEKVHGFENPIVCRDGSRRWMVWNSRLLMDYDGGPAVLAVGQDITGVKKAQQRALQTERLAAIGQMVAGLAHESRNALQRSQACLEMLALTVKDRPEALDLIAPTPGGSGPPPPSLRGRPRLRRPDHAGPPSLQPTRGLARGLVAPGVRAQGQTRHPRGADRGCGARAAWPTHSGWVRSSATSWRTPWPRAGRRSSSRSAPRRAPRRPARSPRRPP